MSTLTIADFRTRFPEFNSVADADVQIQIDSSVWRFVIADWDNDTYLMAHSLVVAHELTIRSEQSSGKVAGTGALKSKSVDSASETWATSAKDGDANSVHLSKTNYGVRYLSMLNAGSTFRRVLFV
jgi:hypothetical protein